MTFLNWDDCFSISYNDFFAQCRKYLLSKEGMMRVSLLKCHVDKRAICHFKKLSKLLRLLVFKKKLTAAQHGRKFWNSTKGQRMSLIINILLKIKSFILSSQQPLAIVRKAKVKAASVSTWGPMRHLWYQSKPWINQSSKNAFQVWCCCFHASMLHPSAVKLSPSCC